MHVHKCEVTTTPLRGVKAPHSAYIIPHKNRCRRIGGCRVFVEQLMLLALMSLRHYHYYANTHRARIKHTYDTRGVIGLHIQTRRQLDAHAAICHLIMHAAEWLLFIIKPNAKFT